MDFSVETCNLSLHVLPHIYVKIMKFDVSNRQMFWWLSGEVQRMACEKGGSESCLGPVFFFGLDIIKVMYFCCFLAFVKSPYVQFKK